MVVITVDDKSRCCYSLSLKKKKKKKKRERERENHFSSNEENEVKK